MMPAIFRGIEASDKINKFLYLEIDRIFKINHLYEKKYLEVFGNPFYPPRIDDVCGSWQSMFTTLNESIKLDQYWANRFIRKDSVVIDAGAYIGAFSVRAASLAPEGLVYCFEPTRSTYETLVLNTSGYPNIKTINSALGEADTKKEFMVLKGAPAANSIVDSSNINLKRLSDRFVSAGKIQVLSIDSFLRSENQKKLDFIKIDSEGYELKILEGARNSIRFHLPVIAASAYHNDIDKPAIRNFISSIYPKYKCKLLKRAEQVLVFYV